MNTQETRELFDLLRQILMHLKRISGHLDEIPKKPLRRPRATSVQVDS